MENNTVDLVLVVLRRAGGDALTSGEIATRANIPRPKVSYALGKLEGIGRVHRVGSAANGTQTWALKD